MNEKLSAFGVVPVVVIDDAKDALPLAEALRAGGLLCAEVTFRTDAAEESIRRISEAYPDMLCGAGTVLTMEQLDRAIGAGARFIVSPGFDPEIVDACIARNIPVYPGCMTPSEVIQGVRRGLKVLKFFPAGEAGGPAMIKALSGPFPGTRFMPTGGVNAGNLKEYLSMKAVAACGGSWMVKKDLIREGSFDRIEAMVREAVELVKEIRG